MNFAKKFLDRTYMKTLLNTHFRITGLILIGVFLVQVFFSNMPEIGFDFTNVFSNHEWYGTMTYMFLHGNIRHLAWNVLFLFFLSRVLCEILSFRVFFLIFFLSWIGAGICSRFFDVYYTVGASWALFGLLWFLSVYYSIFWKTLSPTFILYWKIYLLFVLFHGINGALKTNIDNFAHIGGFIMGICIGCVYFFITKNPPLPTDRNQGDMN